MNDDPDPDPDPDPEPAVEIPGPRVTELEEGMGRTSPGITICAEAIISMLRYVLRVWFVCKES